MEHYSPDETPTFQYRLSLFNDHRKRKLAPKTRPEPAKIPRLHIPTNDRGTFCDKCRTFFKTPYSLRRHLTDIHGVPETFLCDHEDCRESFTRHDSLLRHKRAQHGNGKVRCTVCGVLVRKDGMRDHQLTKICYKTFTARAARLFQPVSLPKSPNSGHLHARDNIGRVGTGNPVLARGVGRSQDEVWPRIDSQVRPLVQPQGPSEVDNPIRADATMESPRTAQPVLDVSIPDSCKDDNAGVSPGGGGGNFTELALDSPPKPEIVSNTVRDGIFDALFGDGRKPVDELIDEVEKRRTAHEQAAMFARKYNNKRTPSNRGFPRTKQQPRRFYDMSLGSQCALCMGTLGPDAETAFQHAKSHIQRCCKPELRCSVCKVEFAFKLDLKLHSSGLEMWSFCSELPPAEVHDPSDWVAAAWVAARDSFVQLLRSWESLQLHWYLVAVENLLKGHHKDGREWRSQTLQPPLLVAPQTIKHATHHGYQFRQSHADLDTLLKKFRETTLSGYRAGKSGTARHESKSEAMKSSGGRIEPLSLSDDCKQPSPSLVFGGWLIKDEASKLDRVAQRVQE